jgi:phosphoribosyl-ATP pyrophosphohydrolase/phosphoribosyl-AMP cyclohydrolase/histidinol dehydrogenase
MILRTILFGELDALVRDREPVDPATLEAASGILSDVRANGDEALRRYASEHDGLGDGDALIVHRDALDGALDRIDSSARSVLERTAARVRRFAAAQRHALESTAIPIDGGRAGQLVAPVERAGCYAPGGGYPLPSSVLMTALTARVAGVARVVVASPKPKPIMLAAAAIAGADSFLCAGGAHAIAALAYGTSSVPSVDVIVGPGNRWVTAAKKLVVGKVGIDMLAGPSELVVLADESADPKLIAADLLAQAEHARDALPMLVTTSAALIAEVNHALAQQLADLPTAAVARDALQHGFAVLCATGEECIAASDRIAPEHLELIARDAEVQSRKLSHYGALFIGAGSAEVLGDYGAGPNHVLPTGAGARFCGGLSVLTFTRVRTWLRIEDPAASAELRDDAAALARIEGLEAHARAALARGQSG